MIGLADQLQRIEAAFRALGSSKAPAKASAKALATTKKLVGAVHPEVETLWSWGLAPTVFESGELGLDGELEWLTAADAAHALTELRDVKEFPKTYVPLATDGAGNFLCHDAKTAKLMDWDHETRATQLVSKTLAGYLDHRRIKAERAIRERVNAAKEAAAPKPARPVGALPKGLRKVTSPELNRFDSKGYGGGADDAALSDDQRFTVILFSSSTLLWDSRTKKEVESEFRFRRTEIASFDPSCTRLVRATSLEASICEVAGKVTHRWELELYRPSRARFSPDGASVFLLSDGALEMYRVADLPKAKGFEGDAKKCAPAFRFAPKKPEGSCVDCAIADDGTVLVARTTNTYSDIELTLWSSGSGKVLAQNVSKGWVTSVALSRDGTIGAAGTRDGTIHVFRIANGFERIGSVKKAHRGDGVTALAFDPASRVLVSSGPGELKLWVASTGASIAKLSVPEKKYSPPLRLRAVTATHVLTTHPLALFELR